ncbi:hypothetical protein KC946_04070, partial [Candidatus Saccharibacteria bacterium]|nr:hypothetical protein [Candidatus Saccharibacteria bacterium]
MEKQSSQLLQVQKSGLIQVSASPRPFSDARVMMDFFEGMTIDQMILYLVPYSEIDCTTRVYINGYDTDPKYWHCIRPKAGTHIDIIISPSGKAGRIIASIAIVFAAAYYAPIIAGSYLGTTAAAATAAGGTAAATFASTTAIVGGLLTAVGNLALAALAPPPKQKLNTGQGLGTTNTQSSPTYFIQGARNVANPFGTIPTILGIHRFVPPLAAENVVEAFGQNNYVRQLFLWGYGELELDELKLGETPLDNFNDVSIQHVLDGNSTQILSNYNKDFSTEVLNITLDTVDAPTTTVERTTPPDIDSFTVVINWPAGSYLIDDKGKRQPFNTRYEIEYREVGSGSWIKATYSVTEEKTSSFSRSHIVNVSNGTYEVRVNRTSGYNGGYSEINQVGNIVWVQLVSIKNTAPVRKNGVNLSAIKMLGTDQLNGVIDRFNGLGKQKILDYDIDTDTWIKRITNNPASILRFVWQGEPNAKPLIDSKIDLEALKEWHIFCEAEGYTYNSVVDVEISIEDLAREVCAAGRASPTILDGKFSIVIDTYKPLITQVVTPHNSWGYSVQKIFSEIPHAFKVQFINEAAGYIQDEIIVYDDGYDGNNATNFSRLELPGITNSSAAYKHARQHLATLRLRPELHTFNMDFESMVMTRGDRIKFNHDVILVGLGSGYIKSVNQSAGSIISIVLENEVEMETDKDYVVSVRKSDGNMTMQLVNTIVGTTSTLTFRTPV